MCIVLLSAGVVWNYVLMFYIVILYCVEYRILEIIPGQARGRKEKDVKTTHHTPVGQH
jgi:hypothetical protein